MPNENTQSTEKKGRGWHGDSKGHAAAGAKGGLAKGQRRRASRDQGGESSNGSEFTDTSANS